MERLDSVSMQPSVGKFRDEQIAQRGTWNGVPDDQQVFAALHSITSVPKGSSTMTFVAPYDPGSGEWLEHTDKGWDTVVAAGRQQ